jgi:signal transduction histidine kinase
VPNVDHPHLWLYRAIFVLIAVVVPVMGFATWATPLSYDPFVARVVLACIATAGLVASYVSEAGRRHARHVVLLLGYATLGWFCHVAARHDLSPDDVVGLLPTACIAPMVVRTRGEFAASLVFTIVATSATSFVVVDPVFPPATFTLLFAVLVTGLGLTSLSRARSERRLAELATTLEERVEQRTAELSDALERAEREAEERRLAERRAVAASQAKSRFLANMSHELRTPLNAVIGYTEMVAEELADHDDDGALAELTDDLSKATSSATHLLHLIDDVLDLARVEADELPLQLGTVSIGDVVHAAVSHTPQVAGNPVRDLQVDVPSLAVMADEQRLTQVLVNLLSNAAKFCDRGSVQIGARREGDRVGLSVTDTGPGIPAEHLPHLFERFSQADDSATRAHGGVGLGLAISRVLVERMNGRIEVDSSPGQGATFTVWLMAA